MSVSETMGRRGFLKASAAAAAAAAMPVRAEPSPAGMKALLLHLGHNMWCDWFPPELPQPEPGSPGAPNTTLRTKDELWLETTDYAAAKGLDTIVIDLGEGVVWPSHPELAINGSWSPEKLRAELARLRAKGITPVPKLNFSTTHNGWLKQYRRMLSTPQYYRVCEDLIRDVAEMFDHPKLFHIGCDEETATHQANSKRCKLITVRLGEFWWHDFLHIVRTSERNGMRAWAWSDYGWDHWNEFEKNCPKSVLLSNWYYDESYGGFDLATNKTSDNKRLKNFSLLEKAGFEQIPCGTNWAGWKRKKLNVGADDVIGKLVSYCRANIAPERLKGFLMAPWASTDTPDHVNFIKRGIDLLVAALG